MRDSFTTLIGGSAHNLIRRQIPLTTLFRLDHQQAHWLAANISALLLSIPNSMTNSSHQLDRHRY